MGEDRLLIENLEADISSYCTEVVILTAERDALLATIQAALTFLADGCPGSAAAHLEGAVERVEHLLPPTPPRIPPREESEGSEESPRPVA